MVKSSLLKIADYRKVIRFQSVLRIAALVRGIRAKHKKVTEQELIAIFEGIYSPDLIREGIERAKHYISIKKTR